MGEHSFERMLEEVSPPPLEEEVSPPYKLSGSGMFDSLFITPSSRASKVLMISNMAFLS